MNSKTEQTQNSQIHYMKPLSKGWTREEVPKELSILRKLMWKHKTWNLCDLAREIHWRTFTTMCSRVLYSQEEEQSCINLGQKDKTGWRP